MNDILGVEVVDGGQDSEKQLLRQVLRVHALLHDAVEQIAAAYEVHHQVHGLLGLELFTKGVGGCRVGGEESTAYAIDEAVAKR